MEDFQKQTKHPVTLRLQHYSDNLKTLLLSRYKQPLRPRCLLIKQRFRYDKHDADVVTVTGVPNVRVVAH